MAKVTPKAIGTFYRKLSQSGRSDSKNPGGPLSDNTVNKIHVLFKAIHTAAFEDLVISTNPFSSKSRQISAPTGRDIRAARPEIECWTGDQLASFLRWDKETFQDELHVLWYLIASTGVRRGEALALQWDDINVHRQTIAIRRATDAAKRKAVKTTKTMTDRSLAISQELVTALVDYRSLREQIYGPSWVTNKAFVFSTPKRELRDPNDITARWTRTLLKAQIDLPNSPRLTLKGLRHTHATLLMEAGTNPKVVQERLGHSFITTTMNTYSHVTATLQQAAAQSFEEMLQAK
jgi:integrase